MLERRGRLRLPVNGEEISVPSARFLGCPKCGEIVLRFQDSKRLHEDAVHRERRPMKQVINDALRRGIVTGTGQPGAVPPCRPQGDDPARAGSRRLNRLADELEDDAILDRKHSGL